MKEFPYRHTPGNVPPTLAKIPFFQDFESAVMDRVLEASSIVEAASGEVILREGSADKDLYVLLKGRVRVEKDGQIVAGIGEPGQLLGEMALLNEEGRSASVIASSDAYCLKVPNAALQSLSAEDRFAYYASVYRFVAQLLAKRLEETNGKLIAAERLVNELRK